MIRQVKLHHQKGPAAGKKGVFTQWLALKGRALAACLLLGFTCFRKRGNYAPPFKKPLRAENR